VLPLELPGGCVLRLFEEADAEALERTVEANRAYLAEWLPWAGTTFGAEARREFIRRAARQHAAGDGFQAAIADAGEIAGAVGFHAIDRVHSATSIGYWLAADRQGRGIVTAAVRALVAHAFDVWGLHRVEIRVAVGNERSAAIPRRLGFVEEGVLRGAERFGDEYKDLRVFGLLATDPRP
jgi:ribosomal-protein-serine acetyltransferase